MTKKYCKYSKEALKNALEEIKRGTATAAASKMFGVPRATLISKIKGTYPEDCKSGRATTLSDSEESILVNWIISVGKTGFPVTKDQLLDSVALLIKKLKRDNDFSDGRPGRKWYEGFLKRHPEISLRMTQNLTSSRAAVTEQKIKSWFSEINEYFNSNNISINDPERVFNADEVGFCLAPKGKQVLVRKGSKSVYNFTNANEKESITTLITGNAAGRFAPSMVVFSYDRIPKHIVMQFPDKWGIGKSENGWMTSETFFEYVTNIFHPWIVESNTELPVILYVDGHKSHLTMELSSFCSEKGIILISLVPNATHILQPLDVGVFHPLKTKWRNSISKWRLENKKQTLKKENFAPLLKNCIEELNAKEILKNSFRKCGLFPFNENCVDYSKCLVTLNHFGEPPHQTAESTIEQTPNREEYTDQLLKFLEKSIGLETTKAFRQNFGKPWNGKIEDKSLFDLWHKIYRECQEKKNENEVTEIIIENTLEEIPNNGFMEDDCIILEGDWINEFVSEENNVSKVNTVTNTLSEKNECAASMETEKFDTKTIIEDSLEVCENREKQQGEEIKEKIMFGKTKKVDDKIIHKNDKEQNKINNNDEAKPDEENNKDSNNELIKLNNKNDQVLMFTKLNIKNTENKENIEETPEKSMRNTDGEANNEKTPDNSIDREDKEETPEKSIIRNTNTPDGIPSPFKSVLFWPSSSGNKKKAKSKDKMPSVCSSDKWKEYYKKKEEEKTKKENDIKERKRKREELKAEKENKKKIKSMKSNVDTRKKTEDKVAPSFPTAASEICLEKTAPLHIDENDYVIVEYEKDKYPGKVKSIKKDGAIVSVMASSGLNKWKWPHPADELEYSFSDILEKISEPKPYNNRNIFTVPEIEKYQSFVI